MAVRLARHARRQLRLVRGRHRLPQPAEPLVTPSEQPREKRWPYVDGESDRLKNSLLSFHCSLASVVAHLCRRLNRFQLTYSLITSVCLFAIWLPSTVNSSFRRHLKTAGSVKHPLIPSNITRECCPSMFLMREKSSFLIELSLLESSTPIFGFIDESSFLVFIRCGYAAVAGLSFYPYLLLLYLPIIERINHRWLLSIFPEMLFPLLFSPIAGQLVSGFVDRPLEMFTDFRLNSLLIVQIIGFLLCLFSSFVFGVIYASVQQSKPSMDTSWSNNNESQTHLLCFLSLWYRVIKGIFCHKSLFSPISERCLELSWLRSRWFVIHLISWVFQFQQDWNTQSLHRHHPFNIERRCSSIKINISLFARGLRLNYFVAVELEETVLVSYSPHRPIKNCVVNMSLFRCS